MCSATEDDQKILQKGPTTRHTLPIVSVSCMIKELDQEDLGLTCVRSLIRFQSQASASVG
eukprot:scaffold41056_cov40-Cyclotella_meneghiniana.AAC.3